MNHTLVNPPVDRDRAIHEVDGHLRPRESRRQTRGIVVRGAKMVATGSALTNDNFVAYHGATPIKKGEYAIAFFAPMDDPDIRLICRAVVRVRGRDRRQPVRLPALEPLRRERRRARASRTR